MTPLCAIVLHKLQTEHVGMARAIQRRALRAWLRDLGVFVTDRKLRYAVKDLGCVCTGPDGYYIAASTAEAKASIAYLKKKIFPLWEDIQALQRAYPEAGQLDLPL
jgi:hypothetical protein